VAVTFFIQSYVSKFVFYSNEHACCLFRRNTNYVQLSLTSFLKFTSKLFSGFNFITNSNLLGEFRDFCWNFYVGWIPLASARTLFSVFTEILSAILIIRPRVAISLLAVPWHFWFYWFRSLTFLWPNADCYNLLCG
jgi:hypothetical protein